MSRSGNDAKKDPLKGLIPVLIVLALVGVALMASFLYHPVSQQPNNDGQNKQISFPKDEGMHEEISEVWTFHFHYTLEDGSSYYLTSSYYYTVMGSSAVRAERDILLLNTKTHREYRDTLESGTAMYGADSRCAVMFSYNSTKTGISFTDWWTRENGTTEYTYHFQIYNGTEKAVEGNLKLLDRIGKPVFIKENGFIHIPYQSSVYGYLQPRLRVTGYLNVDGTNRTLVNGFGDLTHLWGGIPNAVGDLFIINLPDDYTLIVIKYQYSGNQTTAFSSVVVVKPDNEFTIVDPKNMTITPRAYVFSPYDSEHTVVWAYEWTVKTDNPVLDMEIKGISPSQFMRYYWYGMCYANGTFEGKSYSSSAFTEITKHYMSFVHITHHQLNQNAEIPTDNLTISCQVNHTLPIKSVSIKYNTSRNANWTSIELTNNSAYYVFNGDEHSDIWEGTVPGQPLFTTIYYYLEVTDVSGHTETTAVESHKITIEYPD